MRTSFHISLKRSTQNLQLSTSCRPITPSIEGITGRHMLVARFSHFDPKRSYEAFHSTCLSAFGPPTEGWYHPSVA